MPDTPLAQLRVGRVRPPGRVRTRHQHSAAAQTTRRQHPSTHNGNSTDTRSTAYGKQRTVQYTHESTQRTAQHSTAYDTQQQCTADSAQCDTHTKTHSAQHSTAHGTQQPREQYTTRNANTAHIAHTHARARADTTRQRRKRPHAAEGRWQARHGHTPRPLWRDSARVRGTRASERRTQPQQHIAKADTGGRRTWR